MDYDSIDLEELDTEDGLDLGNSQEDYSSEITQGKGKKNHFNFGSDSIKKIIAVIVIIVLIGGGFGVKKLFFSPKSDAKTEQVSSNSKDLFKASIADAVKAQKEKHNINVLWRNLTVEYSKTQDSKKFKEELLKLNDDRTKVLESIPEGDGKSTELNSIVRDGYVNAHKFMNQAYNAKDSDSAVEIYNSFNEADKRYDNDYLDKLLGLLKENNIKYDVKTADDGTTTINY